MEQIFALLFEFVFEIRFDLAFEIFDWFKTCSKKTTESTAFFKFKLFGEFL